VILLFFSIGKCLNILIQLPYLFIGFILLQALGFHLILSLSTVALAIGVVVDDGIVMVETPIEPSLRNKKKWITIIINR
jgi:Cu(I)/Ag(I) efflux system membrane protein CusA/SilA